MKYNKPALTFEEQIVHLSSCGMRFDNPQIAVHHLKHLNYYRLSGYWLRHQQTQHPKCFRPGTTFEQVLADYNFDRRLKLLVLAAVETIEVSVRTRWAYELGTRYGSHAHLDSTLFKPDGKTWRYREALDRLESSVQQSHEQFITHLRGKYEEPLPPIWAVVEVMSLGQISHWFANLRTLADRKPLQPA